VLIARDIAVRYKRSFLGLWWALLNPVLRVLVMWVVLSQVFRAAPIGVPYIVYLFSGVVVYTFFEQSVVGAGASIVNSSGLISKIHVPAQHFAVSAVASAAVTFGLSLLALGAVQLATGTGIPWTWVLLPLPFAALAALSVGVGLVVASAAVRFFDSLDLTIVLLGLLAFLTPTFYPLSSVGEEFQVVIRANPLTEFLSVFRGLFYDGTIAPLWEWAVCAGSGLGALTLGLVVFSRTWRSAALML
jgi:ABC-type polysaccharide/polyol phosphate export permease